MAPPLSATLALGALALVVVLLVAIGKRTKKRGKTSNSRSVWISLNSVRDAVAATEDLSTFKFDSLLSARRKSRHGQVFDDGLYKFVPVLVTDKKGKESNKTLVAYEHRNRSSNVWWWFTVVAGRVTSSLALPDGFRPIDRVDKDGAVFPPRAGELVTFCNSLRALLAAEDAADPPPQVMMVAPSLRPPLIPPPPPRRLSSDRQPERRRGSPLVSSRTGRQSANGCKVSKLCYCARQVRRHCLPRSLRYFNFSLGRRAQHLPGFPARSYCKL